MTQDIPLGREHIANIFPLTPLQEGMLFRELAGSGSAYVMQTRLRAEGELASDDFRRAWQMLMDRHEVLRMLISHDGADRPLQVTLKRLDPPVSFFDLSASSESDAESEIDTFCRRELDMGFDLKRPPLFRIGLFRISPSLHVIVMTFHHIIMDGWCQGILHDELLECCAAAREQRRPDLPSVQLFSNYVRYLEGLDSAAGQAFWGSLLEAYEPGGETSWMKRPAVSGAEFEFRSLEFSLSSEIVSALREVAAACGTTLHVAFQALWGALICRLSGKRHAVWGSVVSGRPPELPGSDRTIGLFINTVPVSFRMATGDSFRSAVSAAGRHFAASMAHQHVPLADIQQACGARDGLFDHLVVFENYPVSEPTDDSGPALRITPDSPLVGHTEYDLVCVVDDAQSLDCRLKYNGAVLDEKAIALIRDALVMLGEQCAGDPDALLSAMRVLPDDELALVTSELPEGESTASDASTFPALFAEQVKRTPESPAVETSRGVLSYRDLDAVSNNLARTLAADYGVERGDRVALITGRDRTLIPSILGIMKASAVFVPLDPGYPDDRVRFILDDCECRAVVAGGDGVGRMKNLSPRPVVDAESMFTDQNAGVPPAAAPTPDDVAYIIYTSGSTGQPKGVVVGHSALANFITGYIGSVLNRHDHALRIAFVANYVFDASGRAFYPSLCRGDTVVVVDERTRIDGAELMRLLSTQSVDVLDGTPSLCTLAMESGAVCENISRVVMGGEALTRSVVDRACAVFPRAALTNVYGPTETTIDSTFYHVPPDGENEWKIAPIGRPMPNQYIYVLDDDLNLLPAGAAGEVVIGGRGVAAGYLNRDELTSQRFIADPFKEGRKLYRTGDSGRWRPDGNLQYLGRNDGQVKVRGHRIETGEIMAVIARESEITQCAVVVKSDADAENYLCVYYAGSIKPRELRARMKRLLPSHMIPDVAVAIDRLPLTSTGKIDHVALANLPVGEAQDEERHDHDVSADEALIIDAMNRVLGRNDISVNDNFFESGGHSLRAARLMSVITAKSGKRLPLAALYRFPSPGELAAFLGRFDPALTGLMEEFRFCFNKKGSPLFCFPPYGATGILYQKLAEFLPDYRLECFNYISGVEFVREASRAVLEHAQNEPVVLLGYSGGGNLAFETAREVEASGGKIRRIIMFDSYRRMETVAVPRSRHEQELRSVLSSGEFSVFFSDSAQLERMIENGVAYVEYLYSGMEKGSIAAPITVISAESQKTVSSESRFGARRSRDAWSELTRGGFDVLAGHGCHDDMFDQVNSAKNGAIIQRLLGETT